MASFGYNAGVLSTPNEMIFSFQEADDKPQRFHMLTSIRTGLDLDKLSRVGDLVHDVINERMPLENAFDRLKEISKTPVPWGKKASALSYALIGAGFAGMLMGSWSDIALAVPLSMIVYIMVEFSGRFTKSGSDWLPLITAFAAGLLASLVWIMVPGLNIVVVVIAAVAVLIPGYTISLGVTEFVGGHVITGNINMVNGLIYLLKQVVGGWIGVTLVTSFIKITSLPGIAPDIIWQWFFVPLLAIGLCLNFQTSRRDFLWALLACIIAYLGSFYGSKFFSPNFGTLLGTVILVIYSNTWSTKTGHPTSIVLVPGIVMLVSGSLGFRGLASIATGQIQQGEMQLQQMIYVAILIAAGLVVGNTLSRPKVTL